MTLDVGAARARFSALQKSLVLFDGPGGTQVPDEVIDAVLSHANHLSLPRDTPLKRALFACDELSGFVHACGLVRPTGLDGLEPKSVRKKLKQPSFAAGVHRDEVYAGAELLGLELDDHIRNVVAALQLIAPELGLRTAADAA